MVIKIKKSIIPACDVDDIKKFEEIVKATHDLEKLGAYKIGFSLGLKYGLADVVDIARKHTNKPLIYDHQKAGTDIPDTGIIFAKVIKNAGIDAVILFPLSGPQTLTAWVNACLEQGLKVIVGGLMTHKGFLASEGGYINDDKIINIYIDAYKQGIKDFVVPGNKIDFIKKIKSLFSDSILYSPGFVAQGGVLSDAAKVSGERWHAIIGRGIYEAKDIRKAALEFCKQI